MRNTPPPPGELPGDESPEKVMNGAKSSVLEEGVRKAIGRLCKWKGVLTMWQCGKGASNESGEFRAISDLREQLLIQSVQNNAILGALLGKKIITQAEWANALIMESQAMEKYMEKRFPGFRANDSGIEIASKVAEETMKQLNFPP